MGKLARIPGEGTRAARSEAFPPTTLWICSLTQGTFENTGGKLAQSRETGACSWAVGWGGGRQRRKAHEWGDLR